LEHHDRIGLCALDQWQALGAEFFKRLTALLRHTTSPYKPLAPRPTSDAPSAGRHHVFAKM
jgi:hypothetical protein